MPTQKSDFYSLQPFNIPDFCVFDHKSSFLVNSNIIDLAKVRVIKPNLSLRLDQFTVGFFNQTTIWIHINQFVEQIGKQPFVDQINFRTNNIHLSDKPESNNFRFSTFFYFFGCGPSMCQCRHQLKTVVDEITKSRNLATAGWSII